MISGTSSPDPFVFTESVAAQAGDNDTSAKTLSTQTLNGGIRNGLLIIDGQSNACNVSPPNSYAPTNATKIDNFNFYDGAIYKGTGPLLGCSSVKTAAGAPTGRNFALVLADSLITANLFDRIILAPMGVGATLIDDHVNGASSTRLQAMVNRLNARGLLSSVTAILWGQGESDNGAGTSQVAYTASFNAYAAKWRALGVTAPIFVALQTWTGASSAAVRAAQAAVVNHGSGIWQGPDGDTLDNTNRQVGGTDFNDTGVDAYAALWKTALHAYGAPF